MEGPMFTTPAATTGIGNPSGPSEIGNGQNDGGTIEKVGSGDTFNFKAKYKKLKSLKDYLKKKKND